MALAPCPVNLHGDSDRGHSSQTRSPIGAPAVESLCRPPEGPMRVCVARWACVWLCICTNPPSLFQVRQQLSEMQSHVEDGDVAGSPAVPPEAPPAEQDPVEVRAVSRSPDVCH